MSRSVKNKNDETSEESGMEAMLKAFMENNKLEREEQRLREKEEREEQRLREKEECEERERVRDLKDRNDRDERREYELHMEQRRQQDMELIMSRIDKVENSNTRPIGTLEEAAKLGSLEKASEEGFRMVDNRGRPVHPLFNEDAKTTALTNKTPVIVFRADVDKQIKLMKEYNISFGDLCSNAKEVKSMIDELVVGWGKGLPLRPENILKNEFFQSMKRTIGLTDEQMEDVTRYPQAFINELATYALVTTPVDYKAEFAKTDFAFVGNRARPQVAEWAIGVEKTPKEMNRLSAGTLSEKDI